MSMSAPAPPDPYAVAAAQTQTNKDTAKYTAEMNMVDQTNPFGTTKYTQSGTNPDGSPKYSATTALNAPQQQLMDTMVNTQQGIGSAANKLIGNLGDSLSTAPNLNTDALTSKMMGWFNKYEKPIWDQQQSNLDSKLAAQGITQGSDAWNNAQNLQARNVGDATNSYLMQAEPTAYSQALSTYQAPIQTLGTLLGQSTPGNVNQNNAATPTTHMDPANISGDIYQSYQSKLGNYENTMNGLFSIPSALLGGWARMGMPSDIRVKENISKVGQLDNGLPIYIFNYKTDPDGIPQVGLMAQDVEKFRPDAVFERNGIKHVDYGMAVK